MNMDQRESEARYGLSKFIYVLTFHYAQGTRNNNVTSIDLRTLDIHVNSSECGSFVPAEKQLGVSLGGEPKG